MFPVDRKIRYASVVALVAAAVGLLTAFGVNISPEQEEAILRLVGTLGPFAVILTGWFTHSSETDPSMSIEQYRADRGPRR